MLLTLSLAISWLGQDQPNPMPVPFTITKVNCITIYDANGELVDVANGSTYGLKPNERIVKNGSTDSFILSLSNFEDLVVLQNSDLTYLGAPSNDARWQLNHGTVEYKTVSLPLSEEGPPVRQYKRVVKSKSRRLSSYGTEFSVNVIELSGQVTTTLDLTEGDVLVEPVGGISGTPEHFTASDSKEWVDSVSQLNKQ